MAVSDLVGVVIGGLIGLAGSIVPHLWKKRRARKSARAIARAYVSGILKMEEIRQHGSLYQQNIATLRAGPSQSLMKIFGAEDSRDELQSALVGQVGLLEPDVARDMVMFCNMLEGLRVDLKAIALGQMDNLSVAEKLKILEGDLKLWNDTQELGRDLMQRLD
jgi:hypothetical protein